jgi:hypothetical protein
VPSFELSGNGTQSGGLDQSRSEAVSPSAEAGIPEIAASIPIAAKHSNPQRSKTALWIIAGLAVLASASIIIWRVRRSLPLVLANATSAAPLPDAVPSAVADGFRSAARLDAFKEELFRLEADRLRGSISAADYATSKQALEKAISKQLG